MNMDLPATFRTTAEWLFAEKPPVLVEVRFPKLGTSPDWFLCGEADELEPILGRLAVGAEVHLHSVWDLKNPVGGVVARI